MITGGFIIGYQMFSPGKSYRVKHPLGLQYLRDDIGRIHPLLTEWIVGADTTRIIKVDKTKIATISSVDPQMHGMFVDFHAKQIITRVMAERHAMKQNESQNKNDEPVENQRFIGEVGLSDEEQINRVMAYKEFAQPTIH